MYNLVRGKKRLHIEESFWVRHITTLIVVNISIMIMDIHNEYNFQLIITKSAGNIV
jgi:hypothetical protein